MQKLFFEQYLIFLLLGISFPFAAQSPIDTLLLKTQLNGILERDQKTRTKGDSSQFIMYIDSCNQVEVEAIIQKYGWPGKSLVGQRGNTTVFLVIQHAELPIQEKYLPLLIKSVEQGESRLSDLALLQDRVLMRQGKKQIYGSQVVFNEKTGDPEFWPIDDEKNVNARREKAGLEPIEKYAEHFGIHYQPVK